MSHIVGFFKAVGLAFSFMRAAILNFIIFMLLLAIIISIINAPKPRVPDNEALYIAPKGVLVDELSYQPSPLELFVDQKQEAETLVSDLIKSINLAAEDERINGIILDLNYLLGGGISKISEIGDALEKFKQTEKPVIAFSDYYSQQQYYLASYADEIYVNELGAILLTGFGIYRNYFKDATDKLAVKFHVFRAGEYKDAIEPYTENGMSDASREHNTRWLSELWGRYTSKIESSRSLPNGAIDDFIATMPEEFKKHGGSHAQFAQSVDLVDLAINRLQLREKLIETFGKAKDEEAYAGIGMKDYLSNFPSSPFDKNKNNIGLIVASGTIYDGIQGAGNIGGDSLGELIRQAREDDSLKALVIRVDSGGGSAFASEVIRQEIIATREQGMPIYISMGSVAASGGYWISAPANEIWATPSTITGSIGVWGLYPNYSESLEKIGVHTDGISTSALAGALRADRPMAKEVQVLLQASVDNIYHSFIQLTADAREMNIEDVHAIAQGRVWTGSAAKDLGLIDNLGSLNDVFEAAAANLNISDYKVKRITRPLSKREQIMRSLMEASANLGKNIRNSFIGGLIGTALDSSATKSFSSLLNTAQNVMNLPTGSHSEILTQCVNCTAP